MLEFDLHSPVPDMRIGKYVGDLVDRPCRDTGRVQPLDPCVGAGCGEQRDQFALKRRLVNGAGAIGGEAGIFCKIRAADRFTQSPELRIISYREIDPAVSGQE